MPEGEEFYLAPIPLGYYRYPDLLNGSLQIEHLVEINEAMSYQKENEYRIIEARKRSSD